MNFLDTIQKKYCEGSNFVKILSVGNELFNDDTKTGRRTDMTNVMVAFKNFVNAPVKVSILHVLSSKYVTNLNV